MTHPHTPNLHLGSAYGRLAAIALLAASLLVGAAAFAPGSAEARLCPSPDPEACMLRCLAHKRECYQACKARKKQCIHKVRLQAKRCMLDCRSEDSAADEVGACKRRCVAAAREIAKAECLADRPVCLKQCNPRPCGRRCRANDAGTDATTSDDAARAGAGGADGASDRPSDRPAPICEPPVDNECLGECARELRSCASRVREGAGACARGCSDLRGEERRLCYGDCASLAREHGAVCVSTFRECVGECPRLDGGDDGAGNE